ncbi:uncharacterized protein IWZ02DRAFT_255753 [Phyllosticta citriasiana]|uniref:Uncharacterized protein n=1 Tax=Phyllosticta citriasiana TaxID=595635 RepID=A0ABR1KRK3_9PEZI
MQIAEILSDLDTLRVCEPPAALALVSASTTTTYPFPAPSIAAATKQSDTTSGSQQQQGDGAGANAGAVVDDDADLKRAKDLIALHELFKGEGGAAGKMAELGKARDLVQAAVAGL